MGFGQGLSGLRAASENLDVIGNNVANSKTVGFKASTIAFADVYANSRVGLGVQVASVDQRFTTGNISTTGNQFDMAIDGADGLFRLTDKSGAVVYSRNGQFHADKDFNIVNAQGQQLTGYKAVDGKVTNELMPVTVPVGNIDPQATKKIDIKMNFDSRVAKPEVATFDKADSNSYNYSLPITVYDSLGNPHQLTQYFIKQDTPVNSWTVKNIFGSDDATAPTVADIAIEFETDGRLKSPLGATTLNITPISDGAANPLEIDVNYGGSTQFGGDFSPKFTQNGYTTGEYSSMSISSNGEIVANYTNGETKIMGAIALANFNNLNGLQPVGGNAWIETAESGQPVLGHPGTNGLATLKGQSVEESNVDMSEELVNMIIAQRTYQANAQTIKTQDQILQTLITLR